MPEIALGDTRSLAAALTRALGDAPFWRRRVEDAANGDHGQLHLAVFNEPYLTFILDGKKTIESRFSVNRVAPYRAVARDDLILLKRSSGPIVGIALAGDPGFYTLDAPAWTEIRRKFSAAICAPDDRFWNERARARYATLIPVTSTVAIDAVRVNKRDRRGWVVLEPASAALAVSFR